jgi:hypothetical protein
MKEKPIFHPLSMLPTILMISEGQLESSKEQLINMKAVEDKPYVLDDEVINRSLKLYNEQNEIVDVFLEQCRRWKEQSPNSRQLAQIQQVEDCNKRVLEINAQILSIVDRCKDHTLNKILAKSDLEFGCDMLGITVNLTKEQEKIVKEIDKKAMSLKDADNATFLVGMIDYMPRFKSLMDALTQEERNKLAMRYEGFGSFARLLEALAEGLHSGEIKP